MIRIGQRTILMVAQDGRSTPFDATELQRRLERCMQGVVDKNNMSFAGEIASSIEMALHEKLKNEPVPTAKAEDIDNLALHALNCCGFRTAAEAFRRDILENGGSARIPLSRISLFIEENLDLHGEMLDRISGKVFHTMQSIGADDSSPALALELARHFLAVSAGDVPLNILRPDFNPDSAFTVTADSMMEKLSDEHRAYFSKGILRVNPVNLRIFPALQISVWLKGSAENAGLTAPLTEMALIPEFIRTAKAVDALCLAADELFRAHGNAADTPAKVTLHLSDASIFTREWMGCNSIESSENCAMALCRAFACEMSRIPFKMTSR